MKLIFNPTYILKQDDGRVLLLSREFFRENKGGDREYMGFIHPIHAMILSFFDGRHPYPVQAAAKYLGVAESFVQNFVDPVIENEERLGFKFKNVQFILPRRLFIYAGEDRDITYEPEEFMFDQLDLREKRHMTPTDITMMVTTRCATDCIYCYADRRQLMDCQIPIDRFEALVKEARKYRARTFSVIGGEFFLCKQWKEMLSILLDAGFSPFLSTKVPISDKHIEELVALGANELQVSLDTLFIDNLTYMLRVKPAYLEQITRTIRSLNAHGIKIIIHTIVNQTNQSIEDMLSVYEFIKPLENVITWRMDLVGPSLYLDRNTYEKLVPGDDARTALCRYWDQHTSNVEDHFEIKYNNLRLSPPEEKPNREKFLGRAMCTGNYSQLFILPDGNVTMCEELYWNAPFIIGNVLQDDLGTIWNSEKANGLFLFPQSKIPADSACSKCKDYAICRIPKQVCYKEIMKAYGTDKWYYPDTNCPKAPKHLYTVL